MSDHTWDQRISNESIYQRQFNDRGHLGAPNIPQSGPTSSRPHTVRRPYLLVDSHSERRALAHWLQINNRPAASLSEMTRLYPGRPWLYSIHRNIDVDSELSSRNYYNPKDIGSQAPKLDSNMDMDMDMEMESYSISPQCAYIPASRQVDLGITRNSLNMWNQPTRAANA